MEGGWGERTRQGWEGEENGRGLEEVVQSLLGRGQDLGLHLPQSKREMLLTRTQARGMQSEMWQLGDLSGRERLAQRRGFRKIKIVSGSAPLWRTLYGSQVLVKETRALAGSPPCLLPAALHSPIAPSPSHGPFQVTHAFILLPPLQLPHHITRKEPSAPLPSA